MNELMDTAATWIKTVGIAVFIVACLCVVVMHVRNVRRQRERSAAWWAGQQVPVMPSVVKIAPGPGTSPVSGPAPVSQLEPARVPLIVVLGDFYWTNQNMGDDMVKAALRVARNYGELETVREITAARHVVKGELAS